MSGQLSRGLYLLRVLEPTAIGLALILPKTGCDNPTPLFTIVYFNIILLRPSAALLAESDMLQFKIHHHQQRRPSDQRLLSCVLFMARWVLLDGWRTALLGALCYSLCHELATFSRQHEFLLLYHFSTFPLLLDPASSRQQWQPGNLSLPQQAALQAELLAAVAVSMASVASCYGTKSRRACIRKSSSPCPAPMCPATPAGLEKPPMSTD